MGEVLDGKYALEGLLGEGGFARVFVARHTAVRNLRCAVKLLRPQFASDPDAVQRFLHEAETAAALRSRHTVRITDVGTASGRVPYIVMELVEGVPLDEVLRAEGCLAPARAAALTIDVLRSVEEAHERGIVHRDLKPSNVLVVEEPGEERPIARVLDFGIAKILEPSGDLEAGPLTQADLVMCTPTYAAPELLVGRPGYGTDLYALGHMLAELLDGRAPYEGGQPIEVATRQMSPSPVPLGPRASISGLEGVLDRALAKDPESRFSSAAAMREALLERLPHLSATVASLPEGDALDAEATARLRAPTVRGPDAPPHPLTRALRRLSTPMLAAVVGGSVLVIAVLLLALRPAPVPLAVAAAQDLVQEAMVATSTRLVLTADDPGEIEAHVDGRSVGTLPLDGALLPVYRPVELTLTWPDTEGSGTTRVIQHIERPGPFRWHASRPGAVQDDDSGSAETRPSTRSRSSGGSSGGRGRAGSSGSSSPRIQLFGGGSGGSEGRGRGR